MRRISPLTSTCLATADAALEERDSGKPAREGKGRKEVNTQGDLGAGAGMEGAFDNI